MALASFFLRHRVGTAILAGAKRHLNANTQGLVCDNALAQMQTILESFKKQAVNTSSLSDFRGFWVNKRILTEHSGTLSPHQELKQQGLLQDAWKALSEQMLGLLRSNVTGCVEIVLEALGNNGCLKSDDGTDEVLKVEDLVQSLLKQKDRRTHHVERMWKRHGHRF